MRLSDGDEGVAALDDTLDGGDGDEGFNVGNPFKKMVSPVNESEREGEADEDLDDAADPEDDLDEELEDDPELEEDADEDLEDADDDRDSEPDDSALFDSTA